MKHPIKLFGWGSLFCSLAFSAPQKILVAQFGGYGSCGRSNRSDVVPLGIAIHYAFSNLAAKLKAKKPNVEFLSLVSCLNSDAPPDGEAQYVLPGSNQERVGDTLQLRADLEAILKANPGIPVYLIGHSYGGWMSMFLAETLQGKLNLKGLFTIDPIGPDCGTFGVIFGDSACSQAPTDLDNLAIQKRAGAWVNFYQDEDSWLTSSHIPEATENHHILFWGPHGDMDTEPVVWDRIGTVFEKSL